MRSSRFWVWFTLVGAGCAFAYAAAAQQTTQELWWQVITFGSAAAVLVGLRVHAPANRRPWWWVFASLGLFAVMGLVGASFWGWPDGHLIWPLRDLGLVAGFALIGVGTLRLVRARAPDGDPEGVIDGFIVMVALAAVLWDTVFGPIALQSEVTVASQVRFVLFPLLQAGVTAAALRLLFLGTVRYPSAWLVFGAASVACVGNVTWVLLGGGVPALLVNLLWIMSFLLAGAAALHPSMRHLVTPAPPHANRLPFARLAVLGIALGALPVTVLRDATNPLQGAPVSVAATVVCTVLVLWRLGRLVHQRERAAAAMERRAAREAALARISGHALVSGDPQDLFVQAVQAVETTLDALTCAIASGHDVSPAQGDADQAPVVVHLGRVRGEATALIVQLAPGRRLDAGEQEFLQAIGNVVAGAVQRWTVESEMRHRSLHDPLTDLANRVLLLDRLDQALGRSARTRRPVSALFVDLDGFKRVNDSLGHDAGDELLAEVARRLRAISRPHDTLSRLSGDEFVLVCDETSTSDALQIAERVVVELSQPFELAAGSVVVGASVGVASSVGGHPGPEQLLRDADAAMYRAKQGGRGCVEVFDAALRERLSRLAETERELRGAQERGELDLVFQPIVALGADGERVVGAEALLRWHHPRHGLLLPEEFVGLAETRGLIVPLGDWVLRGAFRQAASWRARLPDEAPLMVAVNVSANQLAHPGFAERFADLLSSSGAEARDIVVELTETAVTEDGGDGLAATLHDLCSSGVRIALDDFGTGYSSLTHLRTLPLDILKVDGSFVAGLGKGGREHAIVSALAGLTQELGVTVLAEGVESAEQLIAVRALKFDLAQGFHLGLPGAAGDVAFGFGESSLATELS